MEAELHDGDGQDRATRSQLGSCRLSYSIFIFFFPCFPFLLIILPSFIPLFPSLSLLPFLAVSSLRPPPPDGPGQTVRGLWLL